MQIPVFAGLAIFGIRAREYAKSRNELNIVRSLNVTHSLTKALADRYQVNRMYI